MAVMRDFIDPPHRPTRWFRCAAGTHRQLLRRRGTKVPPRWLHPRDALVRERQPESTKRQQMPASQTRGLGRSLSVLIRRPRAGRQHWRTRGSSKRGQEAGRVPSSKRGRCCRATQISARVCLNPIVGKSPETTPILGTLRMAARASAQRWDQALGRPRRMAQRGNAKSLRTR